MPSLFKLVPSHVEHGKRKRIPFALASPEALDEDDQVPSLAASDAINHSVEIRRQLLETSTRMMSCSHGFRGKQERSLRVPET